MPRADGVDEPEILLGGKRMGMGAEGMANALKQMAPGIVESVQGDQWQGTLRVYNRAGEMRESEFWATPQDLMTAILTLTVDFEVQRWSLINMKRLSRDD